MLCVDTETTEVPEQNDVSRHVLTFGWCVYHRRHRHGAWSEGNWLRFDTIATFWDAVEGLAAGGTRLDIWAHNAAFDARVLDAFNVLESRGWVLQVACLEGPPTIIHWRKDRATIRWLDTLNIWRLPLKAIGHQIGLDKLDFPGMGVIGDEADTYCKRDVEIVWEALRQWWDFIKREDLGTCSPTLASQAFTAFRHRFMHTEIFCDANPDALEIARNSYRGGRVECRRLGHITGPITVLDVNSMYPAVMRALEVPVKLLTVLSRRTPAEFAPYLERTAAVAEVELDTDQPCYPVDHDGRLCFPVGRFVTTLAGPELSHAFDAGHVVTVRRAALYERAAVFTDFVDWCWQSRADAQARGDTVNAWLYKIMGNSLYGKFGQRGRVWKFTGETRPGITADLSSYDLESHTWRRLRVVAGQVQELTTDAESFNSHPAIASYVTSAARWLIWTLCNAAGLDNVLYMDTDSLFILGEPNAAITRHIDPHALGGLKVEGVHDWVTIYGCKDYVLPTKTKRKGVRADAVEISPGVYRQLHWTGWSAALASGDMSAPRTYPVIKRLAREYHKGIVLPNGYVEPLRLPLM